MLPPRLSDERPESHPSRPGGRFSLLLAPSPHPARDRRTPDGAAEQRCFPLLRSRSGHAGGDSSPTGAGLGTRTPPSLLEDAERVGAPPPTHTAGPAAPCAHSGAKLSSAAGARGGTVRSCPAALAPDRCRHGQHGRRDHRFPARDFGLGAGVLHLAHRLLESVLHRRHGHHHGDLLVQPLEDVRDRFHRSLQLQGLSFDAGAGRSASPLRFSLLACLLLRVSAPGGL